MEASTRLAIAVQGSPGVYAVLLGSGVSRAAGIPTGWEVVKDLCRKVAEAEDSGFNGDAIDRWRQTRGVDSDYSDLLDGLAATPSERQALLRRYSSPTTTSGTRD